MARPLLYLRGSAACTVLEPAPRINFCESNPLSLCENVIAASNAGVVNRLNPTAGRFPAQPLLFSENALSYVSLRHAQLDRNQTAGRCFPGSAANTLYPNPGWPASAA